MMNRCKEVEMILEAIKKDLEVYEQFTNVFGFYAMNEDGEKRLKTIQKIKRCATFAKTMEEFNENLEEVNLIDSIEAKSYIENVFYEV